MNDSITRPEPDLSKIALFAEIVFSGLSGFAPVRLLAEKGSSHSSPRPSMLPIGDRLAEALHRRAVEASRDNIACYVVPGATRRAGRARAEDIASTAVVLIDLDAGDIPGKRTHLERHLGTSSLVVASGGVTAEGDQKLHLYWRLSEPAADDQLDRVWNLREVLASKVGGDPSFKSAHQPIRVPGSVHCKNGGRRFVDILASSPSTYALDELEVAVAEMPPLTTGSVPARLLAAPPSSARDIMRRKIREGGIDGTTRFEALSSVIGHFVRKSRLGQMSREQAWNTVVEHNATMIIPPWDGADLRREFEIIEALDRSNADGAEAARTSPDIQALSEDDLARTLAFQHEARWKHVAESGMWLEWTGERWLADAADRITELCREHCRTAAEAAPPGLRRKLLSERTIRAVERLARSDPRMATRAEDWDADPMLLNTPAGIINLDTGAVMANRPEILVSRSATVSAEGDCPLWCAFIETITGGDTELARYLARVAGYCLTGSMREQAFFFLHGSGSNGKSVFVGTLARALGDYAMPAALDAFMTSRNDRHPADLAALSGARLVTVTETEQGRSWAASRIKTITGGDAISVRFMRGNFFKMQPRYKLMIAGNHRPRLHDGGAAMRRRLQIIPFSVTIGESTRDRNLEAKLDAESSGILAWAVNGCAEWRRIGLAPPQRVLDEVDGYFGDEDMVGQWLAECCELGKGICESAQSLYSNWSRWADDAGIERGSKRDFGEKLREHGFDQHRASRTRYWRGLRSRSAPSTNVGNHA